MILMVMKLITMVAMMNMMNDSSLDPSGHSHTDLCSTLFTWFTTAF